jgi:hypothetical protein
MCLGNTYIALSVLSVIEMRRVPMNLKIKPLWYVILVIFTAHNTVSAQEVEKYFKIKGYVLGYFYAAEIDEEELLVN